MHACTHTHASTQARTNADARKHAGTIAHTHTRTNAQTHAGMHYSRERATPATRLAKEQCAQTTHRAHDKPQQREESAIPTSTRQSTRSSQQPSRQTYLGRSGSVLFYGKLCPGPQQSTRAAAKHSTTEKKTTRAEHRAAHARRGELVVRRQNDDAHKHTDSGHRTLALH
jgi:hypothetical protein